MGGLCAVGADEQSTLVVEVADRALDDPAIAPEPGAMLGLAPRDGVADAAGAQQPAVLDVVVAAVGDQPIWPVAGPAGHALNVRDRVEERQHLRDVIAVGAGRRPRQQEPASVGQEVVFDARAAAVDGTWADPAAPFFACT